MIYMFGPGSYDDDGEDLSPPEDGKTQVTATERMGDKTELTAPEDDDYDEKDDGKQA